MAATQMVMIAYTGATPGQVVITTSQTWVVPQGVYNISFVAVGSGGNGIQFGGNRSGGGGGSLGYSNNVSVTPGQSIVITIYGGVTILGRTAGAGPGAVSNSSQGGGTASGFDVNFSGGGSGMFNTGSNPGGGAATYTGDGVASSGASIGLLGPGTTGYGAGGTSVFTGSAGAGGPAGLRIMWGAGRSYPSTNVADQ